MLQKFMTSWRGRGGNVTNGNDVEVGEQVQFTDGPFATMAHPTGEVSRVDHRSQSYPYRVRVPHGDAGSLEIPCARWEFERV